MAVTAPVSLLQAAAEQSINLFLRSHLYCLLSLGLLLNGKLIYHIANVLHPERNCFI